MNRLAKVEQVAHPIVRQPDLKSRVSRLAKPVRMLANGHRYLSGGDPNDLLAGLLLEVHETILPREIKVMADTGAETYLQVGSRRLFGILPGEELESHESCRSSKLEFVLQHLRQVLSGAKNVELHVARCTADTSHLDKGCSGLALASAAAIVLDRQINLDPVPGLFAALKGEMTAWVTLDRSGHCTGHGGERSLAGQLEDLARDGLAEIDAQMVQSITSPDHPGCVILDCGEESGHLLAYVRSNSSGFAAVLPASSLLAVQSAWKSVSG